MVRRNRILSVIAAVVIGFGLYAMGADDDDHGERQPSPPPTRMQGQPGPQGREAGLHQQMETMGRLFKRLKSQVSESAKNASSLDLVTQMEQATLACKNQTPRLVQRMPTTQQADETLSYRQMMLDLFRQELDLEENLLNNDNKKAGEIVAKMDELQRDGHKEFRGGRERGDD